MSGVVAEAFYSDIPLIVVSADRPLYKIDIGDGQTIRQENVLEKHIGYTANLKQDVAHSPDKVAHFTKPQDIDSQDVVQFFNESEYS